MRFVIYTDCVSPHQFPMAKEIANLLGENNFRNIYDHPLASSRVSLGWDPSAKEPWELIASDNRMKARNLIETADVLMSSTRDVELFSNRAKRGLITIYYGERWFKPPVGMLRLLKPSYAIMAKRFVKLLIDGNNVFYYPMGVHAACDMVRICGLISGNIRYLFKSPVLGFERVPGGRVWTKHVCSKITQQILSDHVRMWGYCVEASKFDGVTSPGDLLVPKPLRVLWVGRLLNLKRVDTIIQAVGAIITGECCDRSLSKITLDVYGTGPEESRLRILAKPYGDNIRFHKPVGITAVRALMRQHDVFVLSSNAYEGWGAVVSEALEEKMKVIGTYEAGSSATMLPDSNLFHAGDWRQLATLLSRPIPYVNNELWSAKAMGLRLVKQVEEWMS